jgi:hypothetical protein
MPNSQQIHPVTTSMRVQTGQMQNNFSLVMPPGNNANRTSHNFHIPRKIIKTEHQT